MSWRLAVVALALPACLAKPDPRSGAPIAHVKVFVAREDTTDAFPAGASVAGDAVVLHLTCVDGVAVTSFTVAAPGWTFTELGPIATDPGGAYTTDSFGAVAPDTIATTFQVTTTPPCGDIIELGDEFIHNDRRGGSATFDAHASSAGADESLPIMTPHAGDAVWAAMTTGGAATSGPGFSDGGTINGNPSEYRLANDPAGTIETVTFVDGTEPHAITAVTIKIE